MKPHFLVLGHSLAAPENRIPFAGWRNSRVTLVFPAFWPARGAGRIYRYPEAKGTSGPPGMNRSHEADFSLFALKTHGAGRNTGYCYRGLRPLLSALKPDLLYLWEEAWTLAAFQAAREAERLGIPWVFYRAENRPKRLPWPFTRLRRLIHRQARACLAITAEAARAARSEGFAGEILELPLAVTLPLPASFAPLGGAEGGSEERREKARLIYVGRLIPLKGVDLLLGALARLPECELRVVGDGPERARLEALAGRLGLSCRTEFRGACANGDLQALLAGATLAVFPSRETARQAEQWGKAAAECVLSGLPVLCSATGNFPAFARLFPAVLRCRSLRTPEEVAAAIRECLSRPPSSAERSAAAAECRSRFGPEALGMRYEEAFLRLRGTPLPFPLPASAGSGTEGGSCR